MSKITRSAGLGRTALRAARLVLLAGTALLALPAASETLVDALAQTYASNPTLAAQRAALRAVDEQVPQARAGRRPTVSVNGSAGASRIDSDRTSPVTLRPFSADLSISQPLYRGGRIEAAIARAENLVQAGRAQLLSTEQQVLLDAVTAYMDVVRAQAVVELNRNNEQVLGTQFQAARDRFNVGEVTRTDVSQAESRVSRATATRIQAEGALTAARATYARIVGQMPGTLVGPQAAPPLPASREEAVAMAVATNPAVIAATFNEAASQNAIDQASGELLPTVDLTGQLSRSYESQARNSRSDRASVLAQVRVPLYQGGGVEARIREAKQTASQRRLQLDEAKRQATETAIRAWEGLVTARASIESFKAQVAAAELALEGVQQEATVGSRTVLDTLNAEQELLDARVNLVGAQRDEVVAIYRVLQSVGQLNAPGLALPVAYYDDEAYYNEVKDRWWGVD